VLPPHRPVAQTPVAAPAAPQQIIPTGHWNDPRQGELAVAPDSRVTHEAGDESAHSPPLHSPVLHSQSSVHGWTT
jgi:hypothetical protein